MTPHGVPPVPCWRDPRRLKVVGMGTALPGPPVATAALLARMEERFGVAVARRGSALADRLNLETRHLCRDFAARHEAPRPGHANPDLAAAAPRAAPAASHSEVNDPAELVGP